MTDMPAPSLLTIPDVARILAISEETVRRYIRQGTISGVALEGYWRVRPEVLEAFIQSRTTPEREPPTAPGLD
jgi:excisionase family DNA binding protein